MSSRRRHGTAGLATVPCRSVTYAAAWAPTSRVEQLDLLGEHGSGFGFVETRRRQRTVIASPPQGVAIWPSWKRFGSSSIMFQVAPSLPKPTQNAQ